MARWPIDVKRGSERLRVGSDRLRQRGDRLRERLEHLRLRRIRTFLSAADVITLGNGLAGFLAIATLTAETGVFDRGDFKTELLFATALIGIGLLCDALDGIVARKFGGSSLGGDLDTLNDAITFVLAPALVVVMTFGTPHPEIGNEPAALPAILAGALILIFGILRLARFNVNPLEAETTTFQGLPTPWGAIAVLLISNLVDLSDPMQVRGALAAIVILAFLMISNVAYPKSRGKAAYLSLAMVAAGALVIVTILFLPNLTYPVLRAAAVVVALSIAVSPLFLARRGRRQ